MTRLTFPEPAADLLARCHEILDRHVTPHAPGGAGWAIGGGSALAARWQHRWSKDLDIIVGSGTEFARLTEAESGSRVQPGRGRSRDGLRPQRAATSPPHRAALFAGLPPHES